jgi:hypothetical protein
VRIARIGCGETHASKLSFMVGAQQKPGFKAGFFISVLLPITSLA